MSRLEITTGPDLQLDRQRLVLCQLEKKKKEDGPREHVGNRKEIPASISLGGEGIKRDKPILELTDQGIYSVLSVHIVYPLSKRGELVHLFCFRQAFLIEGGCYMVHENREDEIGILSKTERLQRRW